MSYMSPEQAAGPVVVASYSQLTSEEGLESHPSISPDGKQIVFATQWTTIPTARGSSSDLWTVTVETGETRRVLEKSDGVDPRWSPNGRFLAYWGMRAGARRDISVIPARGGDRILVTDDAAADWSPEWAPDGRFLYFVSDRGGSMNLWRIAVDPESGRPAGVPEPVTTPAPYVSGLSRSKDGQRFVFSAVRRSSNVWRVPFDPRRPWAAQTPEVLPQAFGESESIFWAFSWGPHGVVGVWKGGLGIYDVATKTYKQIGAGVVTGVATETRPSWLGSSNRILLHD